MFSAILLLGTILPSVNAHILLENPKEKDFVTKAEILLMENPKIRSALKEQCEKRKLTENFPIELWDEDEAGAWVLALHIARQDVREKRKPKKKVID